MKISVIKLTVQLKLNYSNKIIIIFTYQIKFLQNKTRPIKMNQYIMHTPNGRNEQKQLCSTSQRTPQEDCPYCLMKRKFNIGSVGEQKCFQHSIKMNYETESQSDSQRSSQQKDYLKSTELVDILKDVQNSLDYYWDHLREISGGNPNQVHKDLQPVLDHVKKIQQKIGKFFYDKTLDASEVKQTPGHNSVNRKFVSSGSQKFLRADFSSFLDGEQDNTQSIKQWVMHFHKIIQLRQLPQNIDLLPFQQDLQMRIFKQSMQRKFMQFADQIKDYEKKVRDVLSKLIFYMEKSSSNVSQKQIEEDILFIEGQNLAPDTRQAELERMLLLQAYSVECLINEKKFT